MERRATAQPLSDAEYAKWLQAEEDKNLATAVHVEGEHQRRVTDQKILQDFQNKAKRLAEMDKNFEKTKEIKKVARKRTLKPKNLESKYAVEKRDREKPTSKRSLLDEMVAKQLEEVERQQRHDLEVARRLARQSISPIEKNDHRIALQLSQQASPSESSDAALARAMLEEERNAKTQRDAELARALTASAARSRRSGLDFRRNITTALSRPRTSSNTSVSPPIPPAALSPESPPLFGDYRGVRGTGQRRSLSLLQAEFSALDAGTYEMLLASRRQIGASPSDRLDIDRMSYEELLELQERVGFVDRGAKQEMIQQLPTSKFKAFVAPSSSDSKDGQPDHPNKCCSICLNDFEEGDDVRSLPCFHFFHREEIDQWLSRRDTCPVCKTSATRSESAS